MEVDTPIVQSSAIVSEPTPGRIFLIVVLAGLVAGVLGWLGGERAHEFFPPQTKQLVVFGGGASAVADGASIARASTKNSALAFGLVGASLGLGLGLAGGLVSRSRPWALGAGLVGLVLAGAAGVGAALGLVPVYWSFWYSGNEGFFDREGMMLPMLLFAGIWSAIGAAGGLAFALGHDRERLNCLRMALAGALGGFLGAVAFEITAGLLFSTVRQIHPIPPTSWSRLTDRMFLALFVALTIAITAARRRALRSAEPIR